MDKGVIVLAGHVCPHSPNSVLGTVWGIEKWLSPLWAAIIEHCRLSGLSNTHLFPAVLEAGSGRLDANMIRFFWKLGCPFGHLIRCLSTFCSLVPFETFFPLIASLPPIDGILIQQIYCVSVYVLLPFGPQTVVISKIFFLPQESVFTPWGVILPSLRMRGLILYCLTNIVIEAHFFNFLFFIGI